MPASLRGTLTENLIRENKMATEEQRITKLETFAADVREYTRLLTETILKMDSRLDRHDALIDDLHVAQANAEAKIAALADAQIRTEEAQANADARIAALAEAQAQTQAALRSLGEKLDRLLEGRNG